MLDSGNILNTESTTTVSNDLLQVHIKYVPVRFFLLQKNHQKILLKSKIGRLLLKDN